MRARAVNFGSANILAANGKAAEYFAQVGVERYGTGRNRRHAPTNGRGRDRDALSVGRALIDDAAVGPERGAYAFDDAEEHVAAVERFMQTFVHHREQT